MTGVQVEEHVVTGGRVLIVDDSDIVVEVIAQKLSTQGWEAIGKTSAREALETATRSDQTFDLFILDVLMPEMSGYELTTWLRRHPSARQTPILLLTSLASESDTIQGLEVGADDFLTKSVSDAEMFARVRSLVALGRLRRRIASHDEAMRRVVDRIEVGHEPSGAQVAVIHDDKATRKQLADALNAVPPGLVAKLQLAPSLAKLPPGEAEMIVGSYAALVSGSKAARSRRKRDGALATLVFDDEPSPQRRINAFEAGADDYLPAGAPAGELVARITAALRRRERYRMLEDARDRAVLTAITDPLTGLYNRGYLQECLRSELNRSERHRHPVSLIMLDLDHFKGVNDEHGHLAGDQVLREVTRTIAANLRVSDLAARYGGEEVAILLPATDLDAATTTAERIRVALAAKAIELQPGRVHTITASMGVAVTVGNEAGGSALIQRADEALYAAKRAGRNRVATSGDGAPVVEASPPPPRVVSAETVADVAYKLDWLLSEDLDSPLTSLRAAAALLAEGAGTGPPPAAMIERLVNSGQELAETLAALAAQLQPDRGAEPHQGMRRAVSALSFRQKLRK